MDFFNILPDPVRWIWVLIFISISILHVLHALKMWGVHRLWHCGHILMALGMAYMFVPPEYFGPAVWPWVAFYGLACLMALGFAVFESFNGRRVDLPWIALTIGLGVMAYMWAMMEGQAWPVFTWLAAVWFVAEALGWFTQQLCGHNEDDWLPRALGPAKSLGLPLGTCAFMAGDNPVAHGTTFFGCITLGIMALGMTHMLVGMQLML